MPLPLILWLKNALTSILWSKNAPIVTKWVKNALFRINILFFLFKHIFVLIKILLKNTILVFFLLKSL
uniref:Putative ovule protein n=1 Tax=Solanum chacoense TaxID=4108 RepID=A0A0V0HGW7_SOLCH